MRPPEHAENTGTQRQHPLTSQQPDLDQLENTIGSLPSFAAQSTNGRNAENRPFAARVANVSVADFSA